MTIDRCYCYEQSFEALKVVADATGADSVAALQRHVSFGHNCQLCHPYVRRMLSTGETVFHEVITDEDEPADASGGPSASGNQP
jgi:bacterioferritin-associated ferredoxin